MMVRMLQSSAPESKGNALHTPVSGINQRGLIMTDFIPAHAIRRALSGILFTLASLSAGAADLTDADYAVLATNDLGMALR
jgi:hypothetical protein